MRQSLPPIQISSSPLGGTIKLHVATVNLSWGPWIGSRFCVLPRKQVPKDTMDGCCVTRLTCHGYGSTCEGGTRCRHGINAPRRDTASLQSPQVHGQRILLLYTSSITQPVHPTPVHIQYYTASVSYSSIHPVLHGQCILLLYTSSITRPVYSSSPPQPSSSPPQPSPPVSSLSMRPIQAFIPFPC